MLKSQSRTSLLTLDQGLQELGGCAPMRLIWEISSEKSSDGKLSSWGPPPGVWGKRLVISVELQFLRVKVPRATSLGFVGNRNGGHASVTVSVPADMHVSLSLHVHTGLRSRVPVWASLSLHVQSCTCLWTYMYTRVSFCVCMSVHTCACIHVCVSMCLYVYL